MTQEEKDLMLRDLCARLPHGVKVVSIEKPYIKGILVSIGKNIFGHYCHIESGDLYSVNIEAIKPYLRPMSSMTEEEKKHCFVLEHEGNIEHPNGIFYRSQDYLNSIHVDYRGLIEKGLALEAPKDMYNLK